MFVAAAWTNTVSTPEKALAERVRELRRRHFGPRGKVDFAQRLGLKLEEYEPYEHGMLPPGELFVRMCEVTGEDLQWLLTGVASRSTVVISGTRNRHQRLLARIAKTLDARPGVAAPLEAFLDLLVQSQEAAYASAPGLPAAAWDEVIPIFERNEWPDELPDPGGPGGMLLPTLSESAPAIAECVPAALAEPAMEYAGDALRDVAVIALPDETGRTRRFVRSRHVACCFESIFAVALDDAVMEPMFSAGDLLLVAPGVAPRVGHPALCKFASRADDRCRVWLGAEAETVHLGRICDGAPEQMPRGQLRWSLEVLYRVAQAA